jgi:hypothetical protein
VNHLDTIGPEATDKNGLATLLACWLDGAFDIHEVCALTGLDSDDIEKLAADKAIRRQVSRARSSPGFGPFLARVKARRYIAGAVDRLNDVIQDPDASASSISKATEMLYALSRMRAEDGARENLSRHEPFHLRIVVGPEVYDITTEPAVG